MQTTRLRWWWVLFLNIGLNMAGKTRESSNLDIWTWSIIVLTTQLESAYIVLYSDCDSGWALNRNRCLRCVRLSTTNSPTILLIKFCRQLISMRRAFSCFVYFIFEYDFIKNIAAWNINWDKMCTTKLKWYVFERCLIIVAFCFLFQSIFQQKLKLRPAQENSENVIKQLADEGVIDDIVIRLRGKDFYLIFFLNFKW